MLNGIFSKYAANKKIVYFLLILIPLLLFFRSLFYTFSPMDEQWLILTKQNVLKDWKNAGQLFSSPTGEIFYRPMLMLSFMLDMHTSGLNPLGYHLTNLVLHIFCVLLVYNFFIILNVNQTLSFLLSLVFCIHPVTLHAVVWVPGRNDLLLCLFLVLSLIGLVKYLQVKKMKYLLLHLICFVLTLFTKENAALLPFVYLGITYMFDSSLRKKAVLGVLWVVIPLGWYLLKKNIVDFPLQSTEGTAVTSLKTLKVLLIYFGKTSYPFSNLVMPTLANTSVIFGIITLVIFVLAIIKFGFIDRKTAWFGILFFLVLLILPAWFGAASSSGELYEHRLYVPLIGLLLAFSQLKIQPKSSVLNSILIFIVFFFSAFTIIRMPVYKDSPAFVKEALKACPDNYIFNSFQGEIYFAQKNYGEALKYFSRSIEINPNKIPLYERRAQIYLETGNPMGAINDLTFAYQKSKNPQILMKRFYLYQQLGDQAHATLDLNTLNQHYWAKIKQLTNAIKLSPSNGILYVNRAKVYMTLQMTNEALNDLQKACMLEPTNNDFRAYYNQLNVTLRH